MADTQLLQAIVAETYTAYLLEVVRRWLDRPSLTLSRSRKARERRVSTWLGIKTAELEH